MIHDWADRSNCRCGSLARNKTKLSWFCPEAMGGDGGRRWEECSRIYSFSDVQKKKNKCRNVINTPPSSLHIYVGFKALKYVQLSSLPSHVLCCAKLQLWLHGLFGEKMIQIKVNMYRKKTRMHMNDNTAWN